MVKFHESLGIHIEGRWYTRAQLLTRWDEEDAAREAEKKKQAEEARRLQEKHEPPTEAIPLFKVSCPSPRGFRGLKPCIITFCHIDRERPVVCYEKQIPGYTEMEEAEQERARCAVDEYFTGDEAAELRDHLTNQFGHMPFVDQAEPPYRSIEKEFINSKLTHDMVDLFHPDKPYAREHLRERWFPARGFYFVNDSPKETLGDRARAAGCAG